ncbi:MAG: hypothetical protein ACRD4K_13335 [Candidatus Acidiferrales bacterium]
MATIACNQFMELAAPWLEGEHLPEAAAHLRGCPQCRSIVADLESIRAAAAHLAAEEVEPPARVWLNLRDRLEKEGLIRQPGWMERLSAMFLTVPRPAIAGALLGLFLVAGLMLGYQSNVTANQAAWLAGTQKATSLGKQLAAAEQGAMSSIRGERNPVVTASLNQNLAIVDNMIAICEKSVRETPQDEMTRDFLYQAYQQKADLLATMTERGVNAQ